jgi:hypothetical protein
MIIIKYLALYINIKVELFFLEGYTLYKLFEKKSFKASTLATFKM